MDLNNEELLTICEALRSTKIECKNDSEQMMKNYGKQDVEPLLQKMASLTGDPNRVFDLTDTKMAPMWQGIKYPDYCIACVDEKPSMICTMHIAICLDCGNVKFMQAPIQPKKK